MAGVCVVEDDAFDSSTFTDLLQLISVSKQHMVRSGRMAHLIPLTIRFLYLHGSPAINLCLKFWLDLRMFWLVAQKLNFLRFADVSSSENSLY